MCSISNETILGMLADGSLTHEQLVHNLAATLVGSLPASWDNGAFAQLKEDGLLCDMGEGYAPYCPRYLLPDYGKLMEQGCAFLCIAPPTTLKEAILALEMFYRHVPSITHYPVYLGRLDQLLEPFIQDREEAYGLIYDFLVFLDRSIPDSYCHGNIGPEKTVAGAIIVDIETKLQKAIPSLTLLYDPEITPRDFAEDCVRCELACAKPSFANHKEYSQLYPQGYGIASCYNALPIGGGAFTLSRLVLKNMADKAVNSQDFFANVLPHCVETLCQFVEDKIGFLVEKSHFFTSNFLVKEGFLSLEQFFGMVGMVGLAECTNILMEKDGSQGTYGHSQESDDLAERILQAIQHQVGQFESAYCSGNGHRFHLHAQVGIDTDIGVSAGVRIPIGQEIDLYDHLRHAGRFHPYFTSGVGDIFPFDQTAKTNPSAIVDIINGGFASGMRYFSTYCQDCDVVRITGYLVKRSDMDALSQGQAIPQANTYWGLGSRDNNRSLERKVRQL
ncbi:MAG: YjjI family glycine radical enzyme [Eubacteriales bacterium]